MFTINAKVNHAHFYTFMKFPNIQKMFCMIHNNQANRLQSNFIRIILHIGKNALGLLAFMQRLSVKYFEVTLSRFTLSM